MTLIVFAPRPEQRDRVRQVAEALEAAEDPREVLEQLAELFEAEPDLATVILEQIREETGPRLRRFHRRRQLARAWARLRRFIFRGRT